LTLLIVTIGLLNIGLGFGLAIYYGFGPPGLDEILEALGPMPPAAPNAQSLVSDEFDSPHDLIASPVAAESNAELAANPPASSAINPLAEEMVLGEVRDLAATAQTALVSGQVQSRE